MVGDFNVDLNISSPQSNQLLDTFFTFFFFPTVNKPTRVSAGSETIIDNIFTNCSNDFKSGIINIDISDHFPIFVSQTINPHNVNRIDEKMVSFYNCSEKNLVKFKLELNKNYWKHIASIVDPDLAFDVFYEDLFKLMSFCCPLSNKKVKNFKKNSTLGNKGT